VRARRSLPCRRSASPGQYQIKSAVRKFSFAPRALYERERLRRQRLRKRRPSSLPRSISRSRRELALKNPGLFSNLTVKATCQNCGQRFQAKQATSSKSEPVAQTPTQAELGLDKPKLTRGETQNQAVKFSTRTLDRIRSISGLSLRDLSVIGDATGKEALHARPY
jgi:hypothetical protein